MCSTTLNATKSPLLLLPPAVRSRIFDHVFGGMVVHIVGEEDALERHYKLKICDCPDSLPRFGLHTLPTSGLSRNDPVCMKTHVQNCTRTASRKDFHLNVLHVSRQVYQETVLRPFRQTVFSQMTYIRYRYLGLPALLVCLVPAQAKAITHMRMVCLGSWFQTQDTIQQLKGLKHLHLLIAPWELNNDYQDFMKILSGYEDQYGVVALSGSGLHSFRLAVEICVESDADAEVSRRVEAGSASVMQWLYNMEEWMLGRRLSLMHPDESESSDASS
jgi:hypothetical protein